MFCCREEREKPADKLSAAWYIVKNLLSPKSSKNVWNSNWKLSNFGKLYFCQLQSSTIFDTIHQSNVISQFAVNRCHLHFRWFRVYHSKLVYLCAFYFLLAWMDFVWHTKCTHIQSSSMDIDRIALWLCAIAIECKQNSNASLSTGLMSFDQFKFIHTNANRNVLPLCFCVFSF